MKDIVSNGQLGAFAIYSLAMVVLFIATIVTADEVKEIQDAWGWVFFLYAVFALLSSERK